MRSFFYSTRESQVPPGARKITHKTTGALAYVYERGGHPCAMGFSGKRIKPDYRFRYRNEAEREAAVKRHFASVQAAADRKVEHRAEAAAKRAKGHALQMGHVLVATWGYDQTNKDFYQVVELIGRNSVRTREIASVMIQADGWAMGQSVPDIDNFIGEPELHRVSTYHDAVKIDDVRTAFLWNGKPQHWTAYA